MSGLLLLTATAVACLVMRKKSMDKIGYTYRRNRYYGGNSGYVGYSMSKRASEARLFGHFPKGDFRSEYNITLNSFNLLVKLGIIDDTEWHHTSKYGNRTTFYSWLDDNFLSIYTDHKNEIDKLSLEWHKNNQKLRENDAYRYAYEKEGYDKETATYHMRYLLSRDITDDNYEELHKKINEYEATDEDINNLNLLYKQGCEIDNINKEIENTVYNLFYT